MALESNFYRLLNSATLLAEWSHWCWPLIILWKNTFFRARWCFFQTLKSLSLLGPCAPCASWFSCTGQSTLTLSLQLVSFNLFSSLSLLEFYGRRLCSFLPNGFDAPLPSLFLSLHSSCHFFWNVLLKCFSMYFINSISETACPVFTLAAFTFFSPNILLWICIPSVLISDLCIDCKCCRRWEFAVGNIQCMPFWIIDGNKKVSVL